MSPGIVNESILADILSSGDGWASIDTIWEACRSANAFDAAFYEGAIESAGKSAIRRALRKGFKDANGEIVRCANIVMKDPETGKSIRVYKQEMLMGVADFVQVVDYWRCRKSACEAEIDRYVRLAVRLHGKKVRQLLLFGDGVTQSV